MEYSGDSVGTPQTEGTQVRSLNSFLNRAQPPPPPARHGRQPDQVGFGQPLDENELESVDTESELKCSSVAFFDAESDLATIFSPGSRRREEDSKKYEEQIQSLELDIVTLMDEINSLNEFKTDAESSRVAVLEENEQLKREAKQLRLEAREMKENIQRLEQAKNMLLNVRAENDALKSDVENLTSSKNLLETTISELRNRISALDSASSDASALRPEAARLQRELDGARAEARDCRDRSGRLEEDLSRMQSKLDSSARDHEAQKNRLEEQVKSLDAREETTQKLLSRSKEDYSQALQKIQQLESELVYVRRQHVDELDRLDRELRRTLADMADMALENRRLKTHASGGYGNPPPRVPNEDMYSNSVIREPSRLRPFAGLTDAFQPADAYQQPPPTPAYSYDDNSRRNDAPHIQSHRSVANVTECESVQSVSAAAVAQDGNRRSSTSSKHNNRPAAPLSSMIESNPGSQGVSTHKTLGDIVSANSSTAKKIGVSPFATDYSMKEDMQAFDSMEKDLTALMAEKSQLADELSRLHQRGGKILKERVREQQVEARLLVISKEISGLRKALLAKPA